jgi:hypothetical protein
VLISGMSEIWSGGYSYLHRDVPLMGIDAVHASRLAPFANYLIGHTEVPAPSGYVSVRSFDAWSLFRRDGACAPPPPGYSRKFWNPRHPPPPAER